MRLLCLSVVCAAGCAPGPAASSSTPVPMPAVAINLAPSPREMVDNPQYIAWAKFAPGTSVTHRSTTSNDGNAAATVTTTTYTLAEVADTFLVVEMQATTKRFDGTETINPPEKMRSERRVAIPFGLTAETFGKPPAGETGSETITVPAGDFEASWRKGKDSNEAGEVLLQTWSSEDVPGRLVKSVVVTPGVNKRTVIELIAVHKP